MQYMRCVSFIFGNRRWWLVALVGAATFFVPILGPIVFMGYAAEMMEKFHRSGKDEYGEFDFNRLGRYLMRGIWPFLIGLILGAISGVLFFVLLIITGLLGVVIAGATDSPAVGAITIAMGVLIYLGCVIAISILAIPMTFASALGQDLGAAFNASFVLDFARKMWIDTIFVFFWIMALSVGAMILGLLLCFVGIYPMIAVMMLAQWHLYWQLYELYLQRGGIAVVLKDDPASAA